MKYHTYGQLRKLENPQAYIIWNDRHKELALCEPFGISSDYVIHDEDDKAKSDVAMILRVFDLDGSGITEHQGKVFKTRFLADLTLKETADVYGVTPERIRQIEREVIRKLQKLLKLRC